MIEVTADQTQLQTLLTKFDGLVHRVDDLSQAMPAELTQWQKEDMKRERPNTEIVDDMTAATTIWPRSRLVGPQRPRPKQPRLGRPIRTHSGKPPPSTRPILRPELYDALCARMAALLQKTMQWT